MPEVKSQVCREQNNDEKIAELAKDVGVPEVYILALLARTKSPTQAQLRIATYDDCKRIFVELKDTRFANTVANILGDFASPIDVERKHEVIALLRQSDNVPITPKTTGINKKCQEFAAELEETVDAVLAGMFYKNKGDGWTIKHVLTNTVKFSKFYEEVLLTLAALRKIK